MGRDKQARKLARSQARLKQNFGLQLRQEIRSVEDIDNQQEQYKKYASNEIRNGIKTIDMRSFEACAKMCLSSLKENLDNTSDPLRSCKCEGGSNRTRSFEISKSHLHQCAATLLNSFNKKYCLLESDVFLSHVPSPSSFFLKLCVSFLEKDCSRTKR